MNGIGQFQSFLSFLLSNFNFCLKEKKNFLVAALKLGITWCKFFFSCGVDYTLNKRRINKCPQLSFSFLRASYLHDSIYILRYFLVLTRLFFSWFCTFKPSIVLVETNLISFIPLDIPLLFFLFGGYSLWVIFTPRCM